MCRLQGPERVRAELARAHPFLKAHQADIAQHHTHPTDTEASEGLGHLYTPTPTAKKGSTLPHRWKAPACPTPRRVLPSPALLGCQYSQGLDILCHQRGILWVSLREDQVPSLSQAVTPNGLEEKAGARTQLFLPPS